MTNYDFFKSDIEDVRNFAEKLDIEQINSSPNKTYEKHTSFIHSYSQLAYDIKRVTDNENLTDKEKSELLNLISDTLVTLTIKLRKVN